MFEIRKELDNFGVTVQEVADYLEVSRSTVYRWINNNKADKIEELKEAIRTVSGLKHN